ncbi:MAG: CoA-transferase subunit beta [Chloroflexota bacterium]
MTTSGVTASTLLVARQMAVTLARLLRDGETVFFGVASPLPMVAALLARALHAPNLVILTIPGGVNPAPHQLPLSTVDPTLLEGATAQITLAEIFDLSARGRLDTAFLSGVQIDQAGRINLSAIGDPRHPKVRLPGGAGSAALMPTARRTLLWRTRHDQRTFVQRLPFVTAAGNVDRVVTPLCVFRRVDGALTVESVHPHSSLDEVRAATGFSLPARLGAATTPPPTTDELAALQRLDPDGRVAAEFEGR